MQIFCVHHLLLTVQHLPLTRYENALRQKVPTLILPYWDSRMDGRLTNPSLSVIWTDDFIGNGFGRVANGPFAYWQTPSGPLIRNLGQEGQLFSNRQIQAILSRTRLSEISEPYAQPPFDFEIRHGEVHKWIGGIMAPAEHSAFDPVFYLHHAFVDYLWELFRLNQRRAGVDPTTDYPQRFGPASQAPNAKMGFGKLNHIHGLSDIYTSSIYTYENSPTCTYRRTSCGSLYLRCEVRFGSPNCVSVTAAEARAFGSGSPSSPSGPIRPPAPIQQPPTPMQRAGIRPRGRGGPINSNVAQLRGPRPMSPIPPHSRGMTMPPNRWRPQTPPQQQPNNAAFIPFPNFFNNRAKRSTDTSNQLQTFQSMGEICPVKQPPHAIQNLYEINGLSDIRVWVYVPVQVAYKRNPQIQKFNVFPIQNSKIIDRFDLYNPIQYESLKDYFTSNKRRGTRRCRTERQDSVFMKAMVHSNGLNYHGTYRDFTLLDARQPFSSSIVYIAVKSPEKQLTEVLFTANDECGRVCKPYCRRLGSYVPCTGAMRITTSPPKLYGEDYGQVVRMVWDFSRGFPVLNEDKISVRFLC